MELQHELHYGEKIREKRKACGLTQAELAEKAGISMMSLRRYERNEREPTVQIVERIANALNTTPAYLMGWDDLTPLEKDTLEAYLQLDEHSQKLLLNFVEYLVEHPNDPNFLQGDNDDIIESRLKGMKQGMIFGAISSQLNRIPLEPLDINLVPPETRVLIERKLEEERQKLLAEKEAENNSAPTKSTEN